MGNHKDSFTKRNGGFLAEEKAVTFYNDLGFNPVRAGLDALNKPISPLEWIKIPRYVRNLPDMIIFTPKGPRFLECKGGYENVHLKINDLKSYHYWNEQMDLIMFIYSTKTASAYRCGFSNLIKDLKESSYNVNEYPENKEKYYIIPIKDFTLFGEQPVTIKGE